MRHSVRARRRRATFLRRLARRLVTGFACQIGRLPLAQGASNEARVAERNQPDGGQVWHRHPDQPQQADRSRPNRATGRPSGCPAPSRPGGRCRVVRCRGRRHGCAGHDPAPGRPLRPAGLRRCWPAKTHGRLLRVVRQARPPSRPGAPHPRRSRAPGTPPQRPQHARFPAREGRRADHQRERCG